MRIPGPRDVGRKSIVERPVIADTGELLDWFGLDNAEALVARLVAEGVAFHRDAVGNIYCNANRLPERGAPPRVQSRPTPASPDSANTDPPDT